MAACRAATPLINQSSRSPGLSLICQVVCLVVQQEQRKSLVEELCGLGQGQRLARGPPSSGSLGPGAGQEHLAHCAAVACSGARLPKGLGCPPPRAGPVACSPPSAPHTQRGCGWYTLHETNEERPEFGFFRGSGARGGGGTPGPVSWWGEAFTQ